MAAGLVEVELDAVLPHGLDDALQLASETGNDGTAKAGRSDPSRRANIGRLSASDKKGPDDPRCPDRKRTTGTGIGHIRRIGTGARNVSNCGGRPASESPMSDRSMT